MKFIIQCTAAEQAEFKQKNLKINKTDTGIVYTQPIEKTEGNTSGETFLSMVTWEVID